MEDTFRMLLAPGYCNSGLRTANKPSSLVRSRLSGRLLRLPCVCSASGQCWRRGRGGSNQRMFRLPGILYGKAITSKQGQQTAGENKGPHEEKRPDLCRRKAASPDVRRLQGRGIAEKTHQPAGKDHQPAEERLHGRQPTCRDQGNQTSAFHGAAPLRRRIRTCFENHSFSPP